MLLLVDDEEADRSEMRLALECDNHVIVEAGTYLEALKAFEDHRDSITIFVADISLPGGNGCELAIAFRRQKPDLRILFVSSHVGAEVAKYYGLGISDHNFLQKPFAADELRSRIREILESPEPSPALYVGVERRRRMRG